MVSTDVQSEMNRLRTEGSLEMTMSPPVKQDDSSIQLCFLNARSLHKHIDDVRCDLYIDLLMFAYLLRQDFVKQTKMTSMP